MEMGSDSRDKLLNIGALRIACDTQIIALNIAEAHNVAHIRDKYNVKSYIYVYYIHVKYIIYGFYFVVISIHTTMRV